MTAGRKRKPGPRKPSGDRTTAAVRDDVMGVALAQPHRQGSKDQRCETLVGRLFMAGALTQAEYDAAEHYRAVMRRYQALLASPAVARPPLVRMVAGDDSVVPAPVSTDYERYLTSEEERSRRVLAAFDAIRDRLAFARPEHRAALEAMVMRDVLPQAWPPVRAMLAALALGVERKAG